MEAASKWVPSVVILGGSAEVTLALVPEHSVDGIGITGRFQFSERGLD
ncbi:MAG: hypothetical protein ACJA1W_004418 [Akkermansiaceae bacterium]|jgi:hypothetical protein